MKAQQVTCFHLFSPSLGFATPTSSTTVFPVFFNNFDVSRFPRFSLWPLQTRIGIARCCVPKLNVEKLWQKSLCGSENLILVLPSHPMQRTWDEPTKRLPDLLNETMLHPFSTFGS